ncbi:hypothetical protein HN51_014091 [Arachis hypogaea]
MAKHTTTSPAYSSNNEESNSNHNVPHTRMLNLLDAEKPQKEEEKVCDYCKRAQWVREAVLGANDGLLSTASLMMMGVGDLEPLEKTIS